MRYLCWLKRLFMTSLRYTGDECKQKRISAEVPQLDSGGSKKEFGLKYLDRGGTIDRHDCEVLLFFLSFFSCKLNSWK